MKLGEFSNFDVTTQHSFPDLSIIPNNQPNNVANCIHFISGHRGPGRQGKDTLC